MGRWPPWLVLGVGLGACEGEDWCLRFNFDCEVEQPWEVVAGVDQDADGWVASEDCDDLDDRRQPGAEEICDGVDNDCDELVDEGTPGIQVFYADEDGDGYGDPGWSTESCEQPPGTVTNDEDCDDTMSMVRPGAEESCDELDRDCDGDPTAGAKDLRLFFVDADGDGVGSEVVAVQACEGPTGTAATPGDCDDGDPSVYPGAEEWCDEVDSNCDGSLDDPGSVDAVGWLLDEDRDGYGLDGVVRFACIQPEGYAAEGGDCDDDNGDTWPGAPECDDREDNDCDGLIDEGDTLVPSTWYRDADLDGYGVADETREACAEPWSFAAEAGDCDDGEPRAFPGNPEVCDTVDNDCNGLSDDEDPAVDPDTFTTWYGDADGDGYGVDDGGLDQCAGPSGMADNAEDCDDSDGSVFPGAEEQCGDGVVQDCDGTEASATLACELVGTGEADRLATLQISGGYGQGRLGAKVQIGGDYDGDGLDDLLLGAPGDDGDGLQGGAVYLVAGLHSGAVASADALAVVRGDAQDQSLGISLQGDFDLDADGYDDVVLGGWGTLSGTPGRAVLFLGPLQGTLSAVDGDVIIADAGDGAWAGSALAVGDLDDDGVADLLVGVPGADPVGTNDGEVWLFSSLLEGPAGREDAEAVIAADVVGEALGTSLAALGDVDGDGVGDLAIGRPRYTGAASSSGAVSVFLGPVSGAMTGDDADLLVEGDGGFLYLGGAVHGPGDVDGDGLADLVGASATGLGRIEVLTALGTGTTTSASGVARFEGDLDHLAGSAVGSGDLDGDGVIDLLVGAPFAEDGSARPTGAVYLVHGPLTGTHALADADAIVTGESAGDGLGWSLGSGEDVDGDGLDDLLLGAPYHDSSLSSDGNAYLLRPGNF